MFSHTTALSIHQKDLGVAGEGGVGLGGGGMDIYLAWFSHNTTNK